MDTLSSSIICAFPKLSSISASSSSSGNYLYNSPLVISSVKWLEDEAPKPAVPARPGISLTTSFLTAVDHAINKFIDPPTRRRPSVDPRHVLAGNYAPVDELPPTECKITGHLPACLDGAYIRNGPNPQFFPRGPYHLFDGDGMLHCLRISRGGTRATLSSRYVRTNKFNAERRVGSPVVPNFFSGFNGLPATAARGSLYAARLILGQFNPRAGFGLANTSLLRFGGRLFALCESDLPYEIAVTPDGDLVTLGRTDFDGQLLHRMTAHPKVDPVTEEMFAFRYDAMAAPFITFFRFDASGKKIGEEVPVISMTRPSFSHDFAITEKHVVFEDSQIQMDPNGMILQGGPLLGLDSKKVPRIGVLPRYAAEESEIRWFDIPGFNFVHTINAWEEKDPSTGSESVVLVAPNLMSVEHWPERMDMVHLQVEKVSMDLRSGHVRRLPLSSRNLDLAVINPKRVGKKNRFVYAAVGDPMPNITGVVKLDLQEAGNKDCTVAERMFGPYCYGGEPFFVAAHPDCSHHDEDDGYLVSFIHHENTGESSFIVMDAKSPELKVVAEVATLPQRVPYGFHGIFVKEKDLQIIA